MARLSNKGHYKISDCFLDSYLLSRELSEDVSKKYILSKDDEKSELEKIIKPEYKKPMYW